MMGSFTPHTWNELEPSGWDVVSRHQPHEDRTQHVQRVVGACDDGPLGLRAREGVSVTACCLIAYEGA